MFLKKSKILILVSDITHKNNNNKKNKNNNINNINAIICRQLNIKILKSYYSMP